jgi:acyl-coenzyme A synthetase/AMP-(fatty) acid ligase
MMNPARCAGLISGCPCRDEQTAAPDKYPREIKFVKELPQTISGKTRRVELRNRPAAEVQV